LQRPDARGLGEQLLHARETGLQQRRIGAVKHHADVIVRGDFLDPEQRLAVGTAIALFQPALKREKGHALHEKHGKGRETEISHGDIASAPLSGIRKGGTNGFQLRKQGWQ